MQRIAFDFSILVALLSCCGGCGEGGGRAPVSGVITLDGQPLSGVQVTFDQPELSPNENVGYIGRTDDSGRYSLRPTIGEGSGAPPGDYRVSLTTAVTDPSAPPPAPPSGRRATIYDETPPTPPERIPPAYLGGKLTFTVPEGGTDAANFELKSK